MLFRGLTNVQFWFTNSELFCRDLQWLIIFMVCQPKFIIIMISTIAVLLFDFDYWREHLEYRIILLATVAFLLRALVIIDKELFWAKGHARGRKMQVSSFMIGLGRRGIWNCDFLYHLNDLVSVITAATKRGLSVPSKINWLRISSIPQT